jgi:hypothetical protein
MEEEKVHDCIRHIIFCSLDRVLDTCAVLPDLMVSIEKQFEYELEFSLNGGLDEPE